MEKHRRFRKSPVRGVINRYLYGLLVVEDIKLSQMAEYVGMSRYAVIKWVYEGRIPRSQETIDLVCEILDAPPHMVFNTEEINRRKHLARQGKLKAN
jgi:transcriptional regulator with XRE-family HTH domain